MKPITHIGTYNSETNVKRVLLLGVLFLVLLGLAATAAKEVFLLLLEPGLSRELVVDSLGVVVLGNLGLGGHVLGKSHGVVLWLGFWFRSDLGGSCLRVLRLFLNGSFVHSTFGLFGLFLVGTPVASATAALFDFLATSSSTAAIVGTLAVTRRSSSAASMLRVAVAVVWSFAMGI